MARVPVTLRTRAPQLLLAFALLLVTIVYFPVTRVYLMSDDFANMITVANRGAGFFIIQPFGGHMLLARNTVIVLTKELFGLNAEAHGWLILITHLVNVWLVFRVSRHLTGSPVLAALAAALWGTSPLQSGTLGWYSVYGQQLSSLFLLIAFDRMLAELTRQRTVPLREAALWTGLLVIGATCFGVGIAMALAFPVAAAFLFEKPWRQRNLLIALGALPVVVVGMYFGFRWIYARFEPMPISEQVMHPMAFSSIAPTVRMFGYLVGMGITGLLQGFWIAPLDYPTLKMGLVAVYVMGVVAAYAVADSRSERAMFALLVVSFAIYGLIALGRANMYMAFEVAPFEAARQVRYHYAATIPLAMLIAVALAQGAQALRLPRGLPIAALGAWTLVAVYLFVTTDWRLNERADCRSYVATALTSIKSKIDAAPAGAEVTMPNEVVPGYCSGFLGYEGVPGWAGLFVIAYPENQVHGHKVRFVEPADQRGRYADPKNRRLSTLLVGR